MKTKLMPHGDGLLKVIECINENLYEVDLILEDQVYKNFNVCDLSQCATLDNDISNLRKNSLQEGEDCMIQVFLSPFTYIQARKFQET